MADPPTLQLCTVCNKPDTKLCIRCKSAKYCSKECQIADWPFHKILCAAFSNFDGSSRPTPEHYRAILFPVDAKQPKLIWLHCEWHGDLFEDWYQHANVESFVGPDEVPRHVLIQHNRILKRRLSNTLAICYRDGFLVDGSKHNISIAAIASIRRVRFHDWRGPVVAYTRGSQEFNPTTCKDLDLTDFRHIVDYFRSYSDEPTQVPQALDGKSVYGVRINCLGDQKMFNKPEFVAVEIAPDDSIFSCGDSPEVAEFVQLPLLTRRSPPNPKWVGDQKNEIFENKNPLKNDSATFLHINCTLRATYDLHKNQEHPIWAHPLYFYSVGSILVVRQDKKPLLPLHLEALCKYCARDVSLLLAHSRGEVEGEEPMTPGAVLSMICRPTFVLFWTKLLAQLCSLDGKYVATPSPYKA